jgi:maleate cis-trans isomerase
MLKAFIALQLARFCKKKVNCSNCSFLPLCKCNEEELNKMERNEGKVWLIIAIVAVAVIVYALTGF